MDWRRLIGPIAVRGPRARIYNSQSSAWRSIERKLKEREKNNYSTGGVLSHDILEYDILPRLPVKSLSRFKCVCVKWYWLISDDPIFRGRQSQIFKPSSGLLYWEKEWLILVSADGRTMSVPDPKLRFLGRIVSVSNSCNGLICGFYVRKDLWPEIYVCNPVTMEVRSIPHDKKYLIVGLAFDPSVRDAHYELICPCRIYPCTQKKYGFDLFSSVTGVWRESKETVTISGKTIDGRSYFVGGIVYFRAGGDVVWFNLDKDLAGVRKLPTSDEVAASTIGLYGNRLCYTQVTPENLEIWSLDGNIWEKSYCILRDIIDLRIFEYMSEKIIGRTFRPLPLVMDNLFLFQMGSKVYFYRIDTGELSEFILSDKDGGDYSRCVPYINSLVIMPK